MRAAVCAVVAALCSACEDAPTAPAGPTEFGALTVDGLRIDVVPAELIPEPFGRLAVRFGVRLRNLGANDRGVPLSFNSTSGRGCGALELYRDPARTGVPTWSHEAWSRANAPMPCEFQLGTWRVVSGSTADVLAALSVQRVLGGSLPPGRYYARVGRYLEPTPGSPGITRAFDAGSIELERR